MLPSQARLRRREDFAETVRFGSRVGSPTLVVHLSSSDAAGPPRAGFVVSRAVGAAVTRNRVRRRLRHLVRERLERLPAGSRLVVRALPPSATAGYATLGAQLDRALDRVTARAGTR